MGVPVSSPVGPKPSTRGPRLPRGRAITLCGFHKSALTTTDSLIILPVRSRTAFENMSGERRPPCYPLIKVSNRVSGPELTFPHARRFAGLAQLGNEYTQWMMLGWYKSLTAVR